MKNISIDNLSVILGQNTILDEIKFDIPEASFTAIVGPNGSGKTTLLKTLLGIIKPTKGSISYFGIDSEKISTDLIGYVPQIKTLDRSFPALPIELVASGIERTWSSFLNKKVKNQALAILEQVGALSYAYQNLDKLSGGQLQRVYLARSLARKPKVLLLDEPATGIDLVCEMTINNLIQDYNKLNHGTVIMVTHDWSAAYHHTNHVLLLNKKQIFFGNPQNAFTDENLQLTFSHVGHKHNIKFGMKEESHA